MPDMLGTIREKVVEFSKRHNIRCSVDHRRIDGEWIMGRLKGCYALLGPQGELYYVGCGAMPTSSIGTRLNSHIRRKLVPDGVEFVLMIATDPWYGALSLEAFLIDELSPRSNKVGRSLLSRL
jgi:hypothetical protein